MKYATVEVLIAVTMHSVILRVAYFSISPSLLTSCFTYSSVLKMEAICSSEMLSGFFLNTVCLNPEERNLQKIDITEFLSVAKISYSQGRLKSWGGATPIKMWNPNQ
jgi:hypothetical protein